MLFQAAVKRAGSLEALLPPLRDGRILAYGELSAWPGGGQVKTPNPHIPPRWWRDDNIRSINSVAGRVIFKPDFFDVLAIGIELEEAAVLSLFSKPPAASGRKPLHDWEEAFGYVAAHVAEHGKLESPVRVAELIEEYFTEQKEAPPERPSIYRKLRESGELVSELIRTPSDTFRH